jgi:hypothetical protein
VTHICKNLKILLLIVKRTNKNFFKLQGKNYSVFSKLYKEWLFLYECLLEIDY